MCTLEMRKNLKSIIVVCILFILLLYLVQTSCMRQTVRYTSGTVVDASSGANIRGAIVTLNNTDVAKTDEKGMFAFKTVGNKIAVRAYGYVKYEQTLPVTQNNKPLEIRIAPFTPKALYLTVYGIGDRKIRESALKLIEETELNALVIDVKGDRGFIPYKSSIPLVKEIGAQKITTVKDMKGLIQSLKEKGIYLIARIVVFKDSLLALASPELAVKNKNGEIWHDREHLAWVEPFKKEVWEYNINIAVEAAQLGFDEIQFDYVRFPDTNGAVFSMPNTEENRVKAISEFLAEAKKRLAPYNVFLNADIFGYVFWNLNDTKIGQKLENIIDTVEYISPMLYPSGFHYGIPGFRNPVAHPYQIVFLTLKNAQSRTQLPSVRFRPWLQAFRDYAFDRRYFNSHEIGEQIKAAEDFGSHGWMLWNPHNVYSGDGLKKQ